MVKKNVSERDHSWLSPSGIAPIMAGCVAKPWAEMPYTKETNPMAERGTIIHDIIYLLWQGKKITKKHDQVLVEVAKRCIKYLEEVTGGREGKLATVLMEEKVIVSKKYRIKGHFDCIIDWGDRIAIMDWKFGYNPVSAKGNDQLMTYILSWLREQNRLVDDVAIELHVVQPEIGNINVWETTSTFLRKEYFELLKTRVAEAHDIYHGIRKATPEDYVPNSYCKWCLHNGNCEVFKAKLEAETDVILLSKPLQAPDLTVMTPEKIGRFLSNVDAFEGLIANVQAMAKSMLENGTEIEGWQLMDSKTRRMWSKDLDKQEIGEELRTLGVKEPFRQDVITITDAEKILGKGAIGHLTAETESTKVLKPVGTKGVRSKTIELTEL